MPEYERVTHPFAPVWDERSRVLILGSFPSRKSRENMFYYGHPRNRFWPVLAAVCGEAVPQTVDEKRALLLRRGIALWDVFAACEILGSGDATIRSAVPNDIASLTAKTAVRAVFANGAAAADAYRRECEDKTGLPAVRLPSTSPANAAWSLQRLTDVWREALGEYIL